MNQDVKQRIVGTVVLLALALIFLPIIFDGNGSYQSPVASRIPEPPVVPVLPDPIPSRPVITGGAELDKPVDVELDEFIIAATTPAVVDNTAALNEEIDLEEVSATEIEISESEAIFSRKVPQLDASGLPEGWSVRLGSFSDADNAAALLSRLQAAGYKAYTRDMAGTQGSLIGVFVGPWLNRAQVDDYRQQLQQEFNLAGLVVRYELESL